jgi:hypothetical protein
LQKTPISGPFGPFLSWKNLELNSSARISKHFVLKLKTNPAPQWRIKSWAWQVKWPPSATDSSSSLPSLPPPPPSSMANLPIDPRPHLLAGFNLVDAPRNVHLHRPMAFIGLTVDRTAEHVTITIFHLWVAKEYFKKMARALPQHLLTQHNVGTLEVQPCPFGDAFIGFNSPLVMRTFLHGPPISFDGYHVRFCRCFLHRQDIRWSRSHISVLR